MPHTSIRIDKWLWFTRKVKTRSKATRLVRDGKVRVNREKISRASHAVRVGDVVTVTIARRVHVLEVLAPGHRRGPATEAALLYTDLTPAPAPQSPFQPARPERDRGSGRPTKRERRQIDRLRRDGRYHES